MIWSYAGRSYSGRWRISVIFRRGVISVNYRKYGKKNCACARKDHPGHGPQYLWNASIGGKTRARNVPLGPELEKVEKEVETYQAFVRLTQQLIPINDRICQMRPVRSIDNKNELEELKKNCGGASPRNGRGDKSPRGACPARSPATRTPGPGSQRNGDSCRHAPDGRHLVAEVTQQLRWRLPGRAP
jgi:hypothetical protein